MSVLKLCLHGNVDRVEWECASGKLEWASIQKESLAELVTSGVLPVRHACSSSDIVPNINWNRLSRKLLK